MYASVPTTSRVRVSGSDAARYATPKSASFANPAPTAGSAATITFCGFTSRWITLRSCAWARASQRAAPIRATSRSDSAPACVSSPSVRPCTSSETRYTAVSSSPSSYSATIPGWFKRAATRASRTARSGTGPPPSRSTIFTATSRSSFSSNASHTTPKPPAPSRRSNRYRSRTRRSRPDGSKSRPERPSGAGVRSSSSRAVRCSSVVGGRSTSDPVFGPDGALPARPEGSARPVMAARSVILPPHSLPRRDGRLERSVSFFDERADRPGRTTRRARPPRGPSTDRQTLLYRRLVGGGVALVIVLLLVLGIKSCRDSARRDAFKNYVRDVAALVQGSDSESRALFALLQRPGAQGQVQLQNAVNGYESDASQIVDRAKGTSHPDEVSTAQRYFVQVLELRRDGIASIAQQLRTALSGQGKQDGVGRIATQMQLFLASDVLYSQRFLPNLDRPLKKQGLLDQVQVPRSRFLPDLQWVRPTVVARALQGLGGAAGPSGPVAPGLHGTSLLGVTARPGGQQLSASGATSITITAKLAFDVNVQNGGSNDERA